MKIDRIFNYSATRHLGGSTSYNFSRGKISGILVGGMRKLNWKDRLTVKVRSNSDVVVCVPRTEFGLLASISNLNFGGVKIGLSENFGTLTSYLLTSAVITQTQFDTMMDRVNESIAFFVDLGHITLENAEVEITIECEKDTAFSDYTENYEIYSVHLGDQPDRLLVYDTTKDLYSSHKMVRSIYLGAVEGFTAADSRTVDDIDIQLDANDKSYLAPLSGLIYATNIFSRTEGTATDGLVCLYSKNEELPADCTIKVTGSAASKATLIIIKEKMLQAATSFSTLNNLNSLLARVEKLEKVDPSTAKAYRHAGIIPKSEELKAAKEVVEEAQADDQKPAN